MNSRLSILIIVIGLQTRDEADLDPLWMSKFFFVGFLLLSKFLSPELKILEEELFNQCKVAEHDLKANSGILLRVRTKDQKPVMIDEL